VIVADTNLIAYLLIPGESTALAEQVLARDSHWTAPFLWRSELRNVLALSLRQGHLSLEQAHQRMALAESLLEGREFPVASAPVLRLASSSRCSAYDCEFVALAEESGVPLVTSDRRVLQAFPGVAVSPERFVARDEWGASESQEAPEGSPRS
jgi:predicted nucleic acid-binding protein